MNKEELMKARQAAQEPDEPEKEPMDKKKLIAMIVGGVASVFLLIGLIYVFLIRTPDYETEVPRVVEVQADYSYQIEGKTTIPASDVEFYIDGAKYNPESFDSNTGTFTVSSTIGANEPETLEFTLLADGDLSYQSTIELDYPTEEERKASDSNYQGSEPGDVANEEEATEDEELTLDTSRTNSIVAQEGRDDELISNINQTIDSYMASRLKTYENGDKNDDMLGWIEVIQRIAYKGDRVVMVRVDDRYKELHDWEKDEVILLAEQLAQLSVAGYEGWEEDDFKMSFALELHDPTALMKTFNMSHYEPQSKEVFENPAARPQTKREDVEHLAPEGERSADKEEDEKEEKEDKKEE